MFERSFKLSYHVISVREIYFVCGYIYVQCASISRGLAESLALSDLPSIELVFEGN